MKYEDEVRRVCGDDWRVASVQEKDGGYGVACLQAFIKGVRPVPADLAAHLSVRPDDIIAGYTRLNKNGVFSYDGFDAKHDKALLSKVGSEEWNRSWAHIAAMAGGFMGKPWVQV